MIPFPVATAPHITDGPPSFASKGQIFPSLAKRCNLCSLLSPWNGRDNVGADGAVWLLPTSLAPCVVVVGSDDERGWRRRRAIGFFHPSTNNSGGGERVLWCAVKAIQVEFPDLDTAVYTCDEASP